MNPSQLIAHLNSIAVGDLETIRTKLSVAREACLELEQGELAETLSSAAQSLDEADLKTYRRRLETVVSKLGHLR